MYLTSLLTSAMLVYMCGCRKLRRWLQSHRKTRTKGISANLKGSKSSHSYSQTQNQPQSRPVQSHSQIQNQSQSNSQKVESVLRSHSSPRQKGSVSSTSNGSAGVLTTAVSRSKTTPLLPTLAGYPHSGHSPPQGSQHSYITSAQQASPHTLFHHLGHSPKAPQQSFAVSPLPAPLHNKSHGPSSVLPTPRVVYPAHLAHNTLRLTSPSGSLYHHNDHGGVSKQQQVLWSPGQDSLGQVQGVGRGLAQSNLVHFQQPNGNPWVAKQALLPTPKLHTATSFQQRPSKGLTATQPAGIIASYPGSAAAYYQVIATPQDKLTGVNKSASLSLAPAKCWTDFKLNKELILSKYHNTVKIE